MKSKYLIFTVGLGTTSFFTRSTRTGTRTTTVDTNSNGGSKDSKSEQDSPKYQLPVTPFPEAGKQEV